MERAESGATPWYPTPPSPSSTATSVGAAEEPREPASLRRRVFGAAARECDAGAFVGVLLSPDPAVDMMEDSFVNFSVGGLKGRGWARRPSAISAWASAGSQGSVKRASKLREKSADKSADKKRDSSRLSLLPRCFAP